MQPCRLAHRKMIPKFVLFYEFYRVPMAISLFFIVYEIFAQNFHIFFSEKKINI